MTPSNLAPLTILQTRVLGVLAEKQHTVPDSYPLSLNALTLGCNQKTARDPVLDASEGEVIEAIDELKARHLVFEGSGSRVPRFEHNLGKGLGIPGQSVALLALLMLRGPQTAAELRLNTERLHRFADISAVEGFLDELATREPPLVARLPRVPGARELRWAHLLSGPIALSVPGAGAAPAGAGAQRASSGSDLADLQAEHARMQAEIDALRSQVQRLAAALGVDLDPA